MWDLLPPFFIFLSFLFLHLPSTLPLLHLNPLPILLLFHFASFFFHLPCCTSSLFYPSSSSFTAPPSFSIHLSFPLLYSSSSPLHLPFRIPLFFLLFFTSSPFYSSWMWVRWLFPIHLHLLSFNHLVLLSFTFIHLSFILLLSLHPHPFNHSSFLYLSILYMAYLHLICFNHSPLLNLPLSLIFSSSALFRSFTSPHFLFFIFHPLHIRPSHYLASFLSFLSFLSHPSLPLFIFSLPPLRPPSLFVSYCLHLYLLLTVPWFFYFIVILLF